MTQADIAGGAMTKVGAEAFARRYPVVWHVIEAEGVGCATLHPAATLRRLAGLTDDSANRGDFQLLTLHGGGPAVLRPQLMPDAALTRTLAGAFAERPDLWRDHINRHVFFWVTPDRRDRFINACIRSRGRSACGGPCGTAPAPSVIGIDAAALLAAHSDVAFFSVINTGSTIRGGGRTRRDETTLRPVHSWRGEPAVELAVRGPVPLPVPFSAAQASAYCDSRIAATTRQSSSASTK
jgi:hypothetical protein